MKKLIMAAFIAAAIISASKVEGQARERKIEKRENAARERRFDREENAEARVEKRIERIEDEAERATDRRIGRDKNAGQRELKRIEREENAEVMADERRFEREERREQRDPRMHARRHLRSGDVALHEYYRDGAIDDIRHDMLMTADLWKIKNRSDKQIWNTVNDLGENVRVKIKGNDYKDFVKVKVDSEKAFVKDIAPIDKTKHVAKIKENHDRFVMRNVRFEDGADIVFLR